MKKNSGTLTCPVCGRQRIFPVSILATRKTCSRDCRRIWMQCDLTQRVLARIEKTDGCWNWTGYLVDGYGQIHESREKGKRRRGRGAHRVVYELLVGPIPVGMELDHLCRNTKCVNPTHLEPVSHAENIRWSDNPAGRNSRKTHCVNGHEFTEANTYRIHGNRFCRICRREHQRGRFARS